MPSGPRGTNMPKSLAVTTVFRARCPVHVHGEEDGGSISGKVAFQKREGNRAKNESTAGSGPAAVETRQPPLACRKK